MPTAHSSAPKEVVTAALLVIGGKILSGRTKDQNVGYIADPEAGCPRYLVEDEIRALGNARHV